MKKLILTIIFFVACLATSAQSQNISGIVLELDKNGAKQPLIGATVSWINTNIGVISNELGKFILSSDNISDRRLVVSYVGYQTDTLELKGNEIEIILKSVLSLNEVLISWEKPGTLIKLEGLKTEVIGAKELTKAACCNLSESFETNATVDITYKDGITGSKEMQILGLSGAYIQLLTENAPLINGLGQTYGINGIPGTQISSINIVKGPGSVIYGHESISGMVNVELKDPNFADKLFVNGYYDASNRFELNVDKGLQLSPELTGLVSLHIDKFSNKLDENGDGFLNVPLVTNFNGLTKFKFDNARGFISQNTFKYLNEERAGGQMAFDFNRDNADLSAYGQKLNTNRFEFYGRTGYVIPSANYKSIGLQYSFVNHNQNGFYGLRQMNGEQTNVQLRLLYNQKIGEYNNLIIGSSYKHNKQNEQFGNLEINQLENTPGLFVENTLDIHNSIVFITGVRADFLKTETIYTPRANLKVAILPSLDLRLSVGSGFKQSNILAENPGMLTSNRQIIITEPLDIERALTYGFNADKRFYFGNKEGRIGLDVYRTKFSNKIIPDFDTDQNAVFFQNLTGESFADNIQLEAAQTIGNFEIKAAYKYLNVYTERNGVQTQEPFVAKNRFLGSLYFESNNKNWNANFTSQWVGAKRLPKLVQNLQHDVSGYGIQSPSFTTINTQVTRKFNNFEIYLGAENLFDVRQERFIVGHENPYSGTFDASYIWGPIEGRRIYTGFRLTFN